MSRLEAARAVNDGAEVRNLYTYVERVDAYRKKVLQCWVAKQKTAERARQHCLGKMISLFAQVSFWGEVLFLVPTDDPANIIGITKRRVCPLVFIGHFCF